MEFWRNRFYQPQDYLWQPTLFQPVGGMDMIVKGFLRKVDDLIRYRAAVTEIELVPTASTSPTARGRPGRASRRFTPCTPITASATSR